jgi:dimethylhistidine N-methyltransferase
MPSSVRFHDCHPVRTELRDEVIEGLSQPVKELPCKLFYDERGSQLFDRICELAEYYPTRTESSIMREYGSEIADAVGSKCLVIEYGSGSSEKTELLLDSLNDPVAYVPIDISREHLLESAKRISATYPPLEVMPVCADYEQPFDIPAPTRPAAERLVYFPGSTIGNFHPAGAKQLLSRMVAHAGPDGRILLGVDMKKDPAILTRAYNDAEGVTAQFNMNILRRINQELGAEFDTNAFEHYAYYNDAAGRVEMHLVSRVEQTVDVDGVDIQFHQGESIWTESSYKYTIDEFAAMAAGKGLELDAVWKDDDELFSVQLYSSPTPHKRPSSSAGD